MRFTNRALAERKPVRVRQPLAYAPDNPAPLDGVFDAVLEQTNTAANNVEIYLGSFEETEDLKRASDHFSGFGDLDISSDQLQGRVIYSVSLRTRQVNREAVFALARKLALYEAFEIRD